MRSCFEQSVHILSSAAEHRTGEATRAERNHLKEFSKLLGRNQTSVKNFSVFDRMKANPERCEMLLKILPCWIMSPRRRRSTLSVQARPLRCRDHRRGLSVRFALDDARALSGRTQAIIAGDSKQMQAQRFAFTAAQVAAQAWREHGLDKLDPDGNFDPERSVCSNLPPSAEVKRRSWTSTSALSPESSASPTIGGTAAEMRLMRDPDDRRVGDPDAPVCRLHHVKGALVTPNTQENPVEAQAVVAQLRSLMADPGYSDALVWGGLPF